MNAWSIQRAMPFLSELLLLPTMMSQLTETSTAAEVPPVSPACTAGCSPTLVVAGTPVTASTMMVTRALGSFNDLDDSDDDPSSDAEDDEEDEAAELEAMAVRGEEVSRRRSRLTTVSMSSYSSSNEDNDDDVDGASAAAASMAALEDGFRDDMEIRDATSGAAPSTPTAGTMATVTMGGRSRRVQVPFISKKARSRRQCHHRPRLRRIAILPRMTLIEKGPPPQILLRLPPMNRRRRDRMTWSER